MSVWRVGLVLCVAFSQSIRSCSLVDNTRDPCPKGSQCVGTQVAGEAGGFIDPAAAAAATGGDITKGICVPCPSFLDCEEGRIDEFGISCTLNRADAQCAAGTMCVDRKAVFKVEPVKVLSSKNVEVELDGYCIPCQLGQYCPQGTTNPYMLSKAILCPAGYVCPDPRTKKPTPEGTFTVEGLPMSLQCNISGTYCPEASTSPIPCPAGHYCPRPNYKVSCPRSFYCRQFRAYPQKCQVMDICPHSSPGPNTQIPILLNLFLMLFFGALLVSALMFIYSMKEEDSKAQVKMIVKTTDTLNLLMKSLMGTEVDSFQFKGFKPRGRDVITIGFQNLSLELRDKRKVVKDVSGEFFHSRISAIMGPSGSGKSVSSMIPMEPSLSQVFLECSDRKVCSLWSPERHHLHQWGTIQCCLLSKVFRIRY